jgi:RIP metalloprotease RseP
VTLTIQRGLDTKPFPLPVTPDLAPRDDGGVIGVKLGANAKVVRSFAKGPVEALQIAATEFGRLANQITTGLQQIVFNFGAVQDKISGPVAIVNVGAEVARTDTAGLYQFAALVNLNLAVVNALPLPALDGGYLALLALEAVRRKKLDQVVEQTIMASGLLLLMGSGLVLIIRDITNLRG